LNELIPAINGYVGSFLMLARCSLMTFDIRVDTSLESINLI